ncbi:MAG: geranylgeranylglycerol-phosphate geranylgeranyltransferase [Rhodothermales bacterium]|nr:geranylgeranylglycerol-phosphate geranylgeranyltransferase [Rhodothermales bacterium]
MRALVQLSRPLNVGMMLAGVAVGGLLAAGGAAFSAPAAGPLVLAMVSAALIGAGANAINDVFDLAIDRVNRPDRPLPSGRLTVGAARAAWAGASALGIGLAAFLSLLHLVVAAASVALLWAYSAWLKRLPLAGNLAVALVLALAIGYGGFAVRPAGWEAVLLGAAFAFGVTFAREVAKDVEDTAGDAVGGARTLPLAWGTTPAVWLTAASVGGVLALMPLALPAGLGADFLALVLPAAGLLLAGTWALLGADADAAAEEEPRDALAARAGRASALYKAAMLCGLLALGIARAV